MNNEEIYEEIELTEEDEIYGFLKGEEDED